MADLAYDASGPASSEPAGITQQVNQRDSSDKGKLRVFISYSRDDLDFADQLTAALDFSGFECFIDREGISGGEDWKRSLGGLISEADTVVFVLTPNSARSPICDWEVEEATRRLRNRVPPRNSSYVRGTPSIVFTVRWFKNIGRKGAQARVDNSTKEQRRAWARKAAIARWRGP